MSLRVRLLFILIAMLWQSVGMLSPVSIAERTDQIAHLVVHTEEVGHHHHADQSLHLDEKSEADGHQHADRGLTPTGMLTAASQDMPGLPPATPLVAEAMFYTPPALDGLLRPPTTRA